MLCEVCGKHKAKLRVPEIGPGGVTDRLMCMGCGEPHTVQPMEGQAGKPGDVHLRLFLLPKEMAEGCTRCVRLVRWSLCRECRGEPSADCPRCRGFGQTRQKARVQVEIPPGVSPGKRPKILRLQGHGDVRRADGKRGDLLLHVAGAVELVV